MSDNFNLIDPNYYISPLDVSDYEIGFLMKILKKMLLIRFTEECLASNKKEGKIGSPVHLGIGQEAIATAISECLNKEDYIFGNHRSHSHVLSLGTNLQSFFAEILCKSSGLSGGRGGSMHLIDESVGFYGSVPIVAGTVPLAVGAGFTSKLKKNKSISVSYFGDGAIEEGVVHESLNLARINQLPVIFVLENNLFSSHLHISQRQPSPFSSRYSKANDIESFLVDGNNVLELFKCASKIISNCRNKHRPYFIEAVTYRWLGHVDWREDIDVGVSRSKTDIEKWKRRDPIKRLEDSLLNKCLTTKKDLKNIRDELKSYVEESWIKALNASKPNPDSLIDHVYRQ
ncbi:thiamine pyrophosphate-dependent dehydrogenase E1 component subunit alpha [Prochlorococcus marinus]|uniref:Dehydrogenase n=1 Tax=Prochlorococcus marinus XMU1408 TaxID=2213228 RepID=A0A318R2B3_PROMR|nr:thiamine pyrophosphate-dependent dehydrogenase E1 component subunit alpha [Prochlorococcus marinus]MBW3041837.1 dehydrogenase [Prochlorococcus marinus str. XMU1408]PYE02975.1 dehydrogenase [Prochlorococcus marinus XMU1408]